MKIKESNNLLLPIFYITILIIALSKKILLPEMFMLFTISYMNYWILSNQYKKPTTTQLIICGILTGLIFWMKYSLCIYIGTIYLFFIFYHLRKKTFNIKYILYPLLGFLIPTIITLGYFIYLVISNKYQKKESKKEQ